MVSAFDEVYYLSDGCDGEVRKAPRFKVHSYSNCCSKIYVQREISGGSYINGESYIPTYTVTHACSCNCKVAQSRRCVSHPGEYFKGITLNPESVSAITHLVKPTQLKHAAKGVLSPEWYIVSTWMLAASARSPPASRPFLSRGRFCVQTQHLSTTQITGY